MLSKRKIELGPESESDSDSQQLPPKRIRQKHGLPRLTRSLLNSNPGEAIESFVEKNRSVFIAGGGSAGVTAALALAERDSTSKVVVIEPNTGGVLRESAITGPGRASLGFHYADKETALSCLENTVKWALSKSNSTHLLGHRERSDHYLRQGWYVIQKDSLIPPGEIEQVYAALQGKYRAMCEQNACLKGIYGDPDNFCSEVPADEYRQFLSPDLVANTHKVLRTPERLIGGSYFRTLKSQLAASKNIKVILGAKVTSATASNGKNIVRYNHNGNSYSNTVDVFVNAAWGMASTITMSHHPVDSGRELMRGKVLATVEAPITHDGSYSVPPVSIFVMTGKGGQNKLLPPDAMWSYVGARQGLDGSWYHAGATTCGKYTNTMHRFSPLSAEEVRAGASEDLADRIAAGSAKMFKFVKHRVTGHRAGVVKQICQDNCTFGISDSGSVHHKRSFNGVRGGDATENQYVVDGDKVLVGEAHASCLARKVFPDDKLEIPATPPRPRQMSRSGSPLPRSANPSFLSASPPGSPRPATPGYRPVTPALTDGARCLTSPQQLDLDASMEGSKLFRV